MALLDAEQAHQGQAACHRSRPVTRFRDNRYADERHIDSDAVVVRFEVCAESRVGKDDRIELCAAKTDKIDERKDFRRVFRLIIRVAEIAAGIRLRVDKGGEFSTV